MGSTDDKTTFELRRQNDGVVYTFVQTMQRDQTIGYKRLDVDLWITKRPDWGWVVWDEESRSCTGRPWNVLPVDQGDHPPEGIWVSRKDSKAYVYCLVYVESSTASAFP